MIGIKPIDLNKLPLSKIIIVLLFLALIFSIRSCHLKDVVINSQGVKLTLAEAKINNSVNSAGEEVATAATIVQYDSEALQEALKENSKLKHINSQLQLSTTVSLGSITAPYTTSPVVKDSSKADTCSHDDCIMVGTGFSKMTKWYNLSGMVVRNGVEFCNPSFKDSTTINIGTIKKAGFLGYFKSPDNVAEVTSHNPYSSVTGLRTIVVTPEPKKWYGTKAFAFAVGFIAGGFYIIYTHK